MLYGRLDAALRAAGAGGDAAAYAWVSTNGLLHCRAACLNALGRRREAAEVGGQC
jgi:hypothetical protein